MKIKANQLDALALAISRELFPISGNIAYFNAEPIPDIDSDLIGHFHCEQSFKPTYNDMLRHGYDTVPNFEGSKRFDGAIVHCGRVRKVNEANIIRAWNSVETDGSICVVGDKTSGIQPLRKWASKKTPIVESFSKYHSLVFTVQKTATEWQPEKLDKVIDGYKVSYGMFSAEGPDKGSVLLAKQFDNRLRGKVADIGAGWGYLSDQALKSSDRIETIDLYEGDWRSLELAKENTQSDIPSSFHWIDVQTEFKKKPYDWVLMNPPFHAGLGKGRAAQPDIGKRFIQVASSTLVQGGRLLMVANRTLPYEDILKHAFRRSELLEDEQGYKIFEAVK